MLTLKVKYDLKSQIFRFYPLEIHNHDITPESPGYLDCFTVPTVSQSQHVVSLLI